MSETSAISNPSAIIRSSKSTGFVSAPNQYQITSILTNSYKLPQQPDDQNYLTSAEESCFSDCCTIIDSSSLTSDTLSFGGDMSPCNESLSSSSSCSSLNSEYKLALENEERHRTLTNPNHLLSRLINNNGGFNNDIHNNNSSDSLSTFVLSDNNSTTPINNKPSDLDIDTSVFDETNSLFSSPRDTTKSIKKLKSSLKLNSPIREKLIRCNSMPMLSSKKSVKFPINGLEDVVFFNKHDTPLSVSAAPSSEEEDDEGIFENDSIYSDEFFGSGRYNNDDDNNHNTVIDTKYSNSYYENEEEEEEEDDDDDDYESKNLRLFWKISNSNVEGLVSTKKSFFNNIKNNIVDLNSNIHLENVCISRSFFYGNILVKNISFEKSIKLKLSTNNWSTYKQFNAYYLESLDHNIDRFQFKIDLDSLTNSSKKLNIKFCLSYQVNNIQYWDNNDNLNYSLKVTKHLSNKTNKKQVSKSNILILNELFNNENFNNGRVFPEDSIDVWFKKSPVDSFNRRYSFDEPNYQNGHRKSHSYSGRDKLTFNNSSKSYNELVNNYCFYGN